MNPVSALIERAQNWWKEVEKLNRTMVGPALLGKKAELLTRAMKIRRSLEAIPGLKEVLSFGETDIHGLGIPLLLPVVGAATIAAASAGIGAWLQDNKKIDLALELAKAGAKPDEIEKVLSGSTNENDKGFFSEIKNILMLGLGGLILLKVIK